MRIIVFVFLVSIALIITWQLVPLIFPADAHRATSARQSSQFTEQVHLEQTQSNAVAKVTKNKVIQEVSTFDCQQRELEKAIEYQFLQKSLATQHQAAMIVQCLVHLRDIQKLQVLKNTSLYQLSALLMANEPYAEDLSTSHVLGILSEQQLLELLTTFSNEESSQAFFIHNHLAAEDFKHNIANILVATWPERFLSLMRLSRDETLNQILTTAIFTAQKPLALHDIWPVVIHSQLGSQKEHLIEKLIQYYLQFDSESSIAWLHDHYFLHSSPTDGSEQSSRKFNFAKALHTLYAWQTGKLAELTPEQFEKDSVLVIDYVGELMTQDTQQFANQLVNIADTPLVNSVIASVMQSEHFFRLTSDELSTMLQQLPATISKGLAQAYTLQLHYYEGADKEAKLRALNPFLTRE